MKTLRETSEELAHYRALIDRNGEVFETLSEHTAVYWPLSFGRTKDTKLRLTLSALIHGNEPAGLYVVNRIVEGLLNGSIDLKYPIGFSVANTKAAKQNRRFIQNDLNRCFGRSSTSTHEEKVCKAIEALIIRSQYTIDLHQTIEATETPFFMFRFDPRTFAFASQLDRAIPIITFWGQPGHTDGQALTEFANDHGQVALTLELGQQGLDPDQIEFGYQTCCKALSLLLTDIENAPPKESSRIFKVATYFTHDRDPNAQLNPGWMNFSDVKQGEVVGKKREQDIVSPASGKMIFPKYGENVKHGSDLFGILEQISVEDLPQ